MRDRLIELIRNSGASFERALPEEIADYLLANGVIVPPCNVGDTVYTIDVHAIRILERKVTKISQNEWGTIYIHCYGIGYPHTLIGKTVFLTREEAEQALKGGEK